MLLKSAIVAAGLLVLIPAFGQDLPTVDQVLEKHIAAVGGKAAIEKINTRIMKGTFETPTFGASGTTELMVKAPNKAVSKTTVEGYGVVGSGSDGETAWAQSPEIGIQDLKGAALSRAMRTAVFHSELKLKEIYPKMSVSGKEKVGERDAIVIDTVAKDGEAGKLYFDAETWLLVRQDGLTDGQNGAAVPIRMFFSEYKAVDGVQVPHTMRQETPEIVLISKFTDVKQNVPVDDAVFKKPAQ